MPFMSITTSYRHGLRRNMAMFAGWHMWGICETNRATRYAPRRIQYIVKETAAQAKITKRVYPHLHRHSGATTL
jgi:site-specific recombinase XerD